jgi:hypothetical protein
MVKEGVVWFDQIQKTNVAVSTPVAADLAGLKATTYDNADLSGESITRVDSELDYDSTAGEPLPAQGNGGFSVRWEGYVTAPQDGPYIFSTESSGGVRVWIKDELVIDRGDDGATIQGSAKLRLKAGKKYPIKIEYYTASGAATLKLRWSYNDKPERVIPKRFLSVE